MQKRTELIAAINETTEDLESVKRQIHLFRTYGAKIYTGQMLNLAMTLAGKLAARDGLQKKLNQLRQELASM